MQQNLLGGLSVWVAFPRAVGYKCILLSFLGSSVGFSCFHSHVCSCNHQDLCAQGVWLGSEWMRDAGHHQSPSD